MADPKKVLIVEDEQDISDLIALHLKREGLGVEQVVDGKTALLKIQPGAFDLLILDWMLPGLSGLEVLQTVRKSLELQGLPVLMLTAKGQTEDIVKGLESGADDYLTKPFELAVLKARVRALLRRSLLSAPELGALHRAAREGQGLQEQIRVGEIVMDLGAFEVSVAGQPLELTKSEFKLLAALMTHRGKVMTRERLIQEVQGKGINVVDRTVDTHVFGLRKKLGSAGDCIETVRGVGYRVMI